ncbi:unnamed protein product [Caretta caretta]
MEGLTHNLVNICAPIPIPKRVQLYQWASAFLGTLDSPGPGAWSWAGILTAPWMYMREVLGHSGYPQGDHYALVDVWSNHHLDDSTSFSCVCLEDTQSCHAWLDHIDISYFNSLWAHSSSIRLVLFLDHHVVSVMVYLMPGQLRLAYWHFNSLLEDVSSVASFQEFWLA